MLVVEPQHIAKYSRCPRRAQLSWNLERPSNLTFEGVVIQHVIQAAYLHVSRRKELPGWRRIVQWCDLHYNKLSVDPSVVQPKEYKSAVSLLQTLYGWYHDQFRPKALGLEPIINVPVNLELGHGVVYKDTIPLIIVDKDVRLADFRQLDKSRNLAMMDVYNDFLIHTRIWGFYQVAKLLPTRYVRFFIMPESIKTVDVRITQEMLENATKISKHILTGIKDRVFYPSFSEQCMRCPFRNNCAI